MRTTYIAVALILAFASPVTATYNYIAGYEPGSDVDDQPDFKDVQFVKLTYFHHQYLEPCRFFDDSECMGYDMSFKGLRIDRTLRTQILELTDEDQGIMGMDLLQSRMFYKRFETIADDIHEQNACDINNVTGHTNMFTLCDDEWITPIKYEIVQKRRL